MQIQPINPRCICLKPAFRTSLRCLLVLEHPNCMRRYEHIGDLPNSEIRCLEEPKKSENIAFFFCKKIVFSAKKNIANTSFPAYILGMWVLGTLQHHLFCDFSSLGNTKIIDFHRILSKALYNHSLTEILQPKILPTRVVHVCDSLRPSRPRNRPGIATGLLRN